MKNLLLVVAFMLSIGAFAQTPVKPIDPNLELCVQLFDFEPPCVIGSGGLYWIHGEYDLWVCGPISWIGKFTYVEIEEMIKEYICEHNKFPDYVEVQNFRPIKIF